jgi:hypothetical protein
MAIFNATDEISKLQSIDFTKTNAIEILVDKEVASFLLSKNFEGNRNVTSHRVTGYRKIMTEGDWTLGDPLKFSKSGNLIDGQHRLMAVPDGCKIPFVILTGQPDKAAETYDQGMKRNALHIARIRGIESITGKHVSIIRMMFVFRSESSHISTLLSAHKIVTIFQRHKKIMEAIEFSLRYRKKSFAMLYAPVLAVVARAYLSDCPLSNQDLDFFLYIFQGGSESDYPNTVRRSGSAPLALRNALQKSGVVRECSGTYRKESFFKTQSALVAYSQKKNVCHFKETQKNVFPVPLIDFMDFSTLDISEKLQSEKD